MRKFKMYSTCIPVFGKERSAIYDLNREKYFLIPNGLHTILTSSELISEKALLEEYSSEQDIVKEYIEFLITNEIVFECDEDEVNFFPPLDLSWDYPAHITNAVIEVDQERVDKLEHILKLIDGLGCRFIQITSSKLSDKLDQIIDLIELYRFNMIEFVTSENIKIDDAQEILSKSTRRIRLVVELSEENRTQKLNDCKDLIMFTELTYSELKVKKKEAFFQVNMNLFLESKVHNTYFNRKIAIAKDGTIKNAPTYNQCFGNIYSIDSKKDLLDIINLPDFKRFWNVSKDKIETCRECEFRYMCVDNRIPILNSEGSYEVGEGCSKINSVNES